MQAEKTNPSQTLEEIFAELRQEGLEKGIEKGRQEGKQEALKSVIQELIKGNFTNEQIANITKLNLEEVAAWRKSLLQ